MDLFQKLIEFFIAVKIIVAKFKPGIIASTHSGSALNWIGRMSPTAQVGMECFRVCHGF